MPDDKSQTGSPDDIRINVNQPYELNDWSRKLGVTHDKLRKLVDENGVMVKDVKKALEKE